jgi:hypothetical protein
MLPYMRVALVGSENQRLTAVLKVLSSRQGQSSRQGGVVGDGVGDGVGLAVVGLAVGDGVGLAVGDAVGLAVGDAVGLAVGGRQADAGVELSVGPVNSMAHVHVQLPGK